MSHIQISAHEFSNSRNVLLRSYNNWYLNKRNKDMSLIRRLWNNT